MTLNQQENQQLRHNRYLKSEPTCKLINRIPGLRLLV